SGGTVNADVVIAGNSAGGSGTVTQSAGTANVTFGVILGSDVGSTGTYNLSGTGSLTTADLAIGQSDTRGTFNQSAGTTTVGSSVVLGFDADATGTYNLSGTGSLTTTELVLGLFGTGTVNQSGGSVRVSDTSFDGNQHLSFLVGDLNGSV